MTQYMHQNTHPAYEAHGLPQHVGEPLESLPHDAAVLRPRSAELLQHGGVRGSGHIEAREHGEDADREGLLGAPPELESEAGSGD